MSRALLACCAVGVTFSVLVFSLAGRAAPAPEEDRLALQKLEQLKKRLPNLLEDWKKARYWYSSSLCEVRLVRRISPTEAKVTIALLSINSNGQRNPDQDQLVSIFLRFYDGAWTATHFQASWRSDNNEYGNRAAHFLMAAIDESFDK